MSGLVKEWRPKLTKGSAANKLSAYEELLTNHFDDEKLIY